MNICIIQTIKGDIVNVVVKPNREKIWKDHESGVVPKELYEQYYVIGEMYSFYFTQIEENK